MSAFLKVFIICICINICISIFGLSLGGDDIVSKFISTSSGNVVITQNYNSSIPTTIEGGSIGTGTTGFSFIDGLKMVFNFLLLILVSIFAPLYWGYTLGFPVFIQLLLFIPQIISVIGLMMLIRGVGD